MVRPCVARGFVDPASAQSIATPMNRTVADAISASTGSTRAPVRISVGGRGNPQSLTEFEAPAQGGAPSGAFEKLSLRGPFLFGKLRLHNELKAPGVAVA